VNKKFMREILRLLPNFRVTAGHYFYEPPVHHVLAGFAWERPPSGVRLWKYAFPLYEGGELHLGYADRLPQFDDCTTPLPGQQQRLVPPLPEQERRMAEEFVRRIEPYRREVSKLRDLDHFLNYQKSKSMENPLIRRGLALTLVMIGEADKALDQLAMCLRSWNDQEFRKSVYSWLTSIQDGTAIQKLNANEERLKRQLDIANEEELGSY
jgi:hypothetical protein